MWLEALKAKYDGCGKPYGRAEFDKLLGHCQVRRTPCTIAPSKTTDGGQAVCDIPAICFAEELIRAYPDAKVIITHRDLDSWHKWVPNALMERAVSASTSSDAILQLLSPNRRRIGESPHRSVRCSRGPYLTTIDTLRDAGVSEVVV